MSHEAWMQIAVEEAAAGVESGQSPFGAVIVRGAELIARGHNQVWATVDPTAHAEVVVIRRAALALGSIDFSGCVMYTTCEPCPMCAAAIHWSKLDAVCYGATIADAHSAGFMELTLSIKELYTRGGSPVRVLPRILEKACAGLFQRWLDHPSHRSY